MEKIRRWMVACGAVLCLAGQCFAAQPEELVPVGKAVGIELTTDTVTVAELSDTVHVAEEAGIKKGDVIEKIDGVEIGAAEEIGQQLAKSSGAVTVTVRRDGKAKNYRMTPRQTERGKLLGIYVRDTVAGIGTITYYNPSDGSYGALGHGVNDRQSEKPVKMEHGQLVRSSIAEIEKSRVGAPGALRGILEQIPLGSVDRNSGQGIFGTLDTFVPERSAVPVAALSQIETGPAEILSNITGSETVSYSIQIVQIHADDEADRNLLLRVTDPALLSAAGGIVQGMSGSPILQNGRLVGAVTHVLVGDPTLGYGIYIGNMLASAQKTEKTAA